MLLVNHGQGLSASASWHSFVDVYNPDQLDTVRYSFRVLIAFPALWFL